MNQLSPLRGGTLTGPGSRVQLRVLFWPYRLPVSPPDCTFQIVSLGMEILEFTQILMGQASIKEGCPAWVGDRGRHRVTRSVS